MKRSLLLAATLLLAALRAAPGASAQGPADSAELVRAVAAVLHDSLLVRMRDGSPVFLGEPATPFDERVAARLREAHRLATLTAGADTAQWVATRGLALRGDTAEVLVETGYRDRPSDFIDTCIETTRYLFVRTPAGWRLARREFVRGADYGGVEG